MMIERFFDSASSVMTVVSFATFVGILAWTWLLKKEEDFAASAVLPFADDDLEEGHV